MASGVRRRKCFSELKDAKAEAGFVLTQLSNGAHDTAQLTALGRESYVHARKALEKTGVPLVTAVDEYRAVHDLLAGRGSLRKAVQFFLQHRAERALRATSSAAAHS